MNICKSSELYAQSIVVICGAECSVVCTYFIITHCLVGKGVVVKFELLCRVLWGEKDIAGIELANASVVRAGDGFHSGVCRIGAANN